MDGRVWVMSMRCARCDVGWFPSIDRCDGGGLGGFIDSLGRSLAQIGEGRDARNLPDAQPVEDVCEVILDVIRVRRLSLSHSPLSCGGSSTHAPPPPGLAAALCFFFSPSRVGWGSLMHPIIRPCTQSPRAEAYTKEEHRRMVADYFSGASVGASSPCYRCFVNEAAPTPPPSLTLSSLPWQPHGWRRSKPTRPGTRQAVAPVASDPLR